ncbi:MAG: ATP-binding protein [Clostridia bacterium]|nr:ATP-binding protein [Clostridia bacterium]
MYRKENYAKVRNEIEQRRTEAEAQADARNAQVRELSPEIAKIDAELTKTGLKIFSAAMAGQPIDGIKKRSGELMEKRAAVLQSLGFPADYTEPQYVCPICKDTGFVDVKMCSCMRKMLIRENIRTSGIGGLIDRQSFENFVLDPARFDREKDYEMMKINFARAKTFAETFGSHKRNLLFIGTTGTGKTHLSTAIAKTVMEAGYGVIYDSVSNIITAFETDKFHSGYGREVESRSREYFDTDLLIIDDLGSEFSGAFSVSVIYQLLNTRLNQGKCTVISTNLTPNALKDVYDGRILSRLLGPDFDPLLFSGKDYRLI